MMSEQVLVSVLTVLLSGVLASIVTIHLSDRYRRRDHVRRKLETAWRALDVYTASANRFIKARIEGRELPTVNTSALGHLEMVLSIYAPEALPRLRELDRTLTSLELQLQRNPDPDPLASHFEAVNRITEELRHAIAGAARQLR